MRNRTRFDVNTDTGTWTDTGWLSGQLEQIAWKPTTGDTGADLALYLLPTVGDTGDGIEIYNNNDCLGADFVQAPRQPAHDAAGLDTGVDQYVPIVGAGDRLRVKVTPGGAAVAGTLYVWSKKRQVNQKKAKKCPKTRPRSLSRGAIA